MQQAEKLSKLKKFLDKHKITDSNFQLRMGANFPIITDLFQQLYADSPYGAQAFQDLLVALVKLIEIQLRPVKRF